MKASKEYRDHLENLDKVLRHMQEKQDYQTMNTILYSCNINHNSNFSNEITGELSRQGYIKVLMDSASTDVQILPKGSTFLKSGGYLGELNRQEEQEAKNEELRVSTIQSNKSNVKYFHWTIVFTIINLIVLIISIYLNFIKKYRGGVVSLTQLSLAYETSGYQIALSCFTLFM